MGKYDAFKAKAERLFIDEGYTAKDIAELFDINANTVGNWVKVGSWKERRQRNESAPHRIKELLLEQLEKVAKGEKPSFNSDDLSKITRALERIDKKISFPVVISVLQELDNFLISEELDGKMIDYSLKLHKRFLQHKIESE